MTPADVDRFWSKVARGDGCWNWTASVTKKRGGYGQFRLRAGGKPKTLRSHRVSYELLVGPVPDGLHLDHLCRNPRCVRPDHLEPVTQRVNNLRGESPAAKVVRSGFCARGHERNDANTHVASDGSKTCRPCGRITQNRRRAEARKVKLNGQPR